MRGCLTGGVKVDGEPPQAQAAAAGDAAEPTEAPNRASREGKGCFETGRAEDADGHHQGSAGEHREDPQGLGATAHSCCAAPAQDQGGGECFIPQC